MAHVGDVGDPGETAPGHSPGGRRLGGWGEPRMQMVTVSEIRKGKPCQTPTGSRRKVAQPTLFGHTEKGWIDMRCTTHPLP